MSAGPLSVVRKRASNSFFLSSSLGCTSFSSSGISSLMRREPIGNSATSTGRRSPLGVMA